MIRETIDPARTDGLPDHVGMTSAGRLVLTGGAHNVAHLFTGQRAAAPAAVAAFRANHLARRAWCAAWGIRFSQWVFPDAIVLAGLADVDAKGPGGTAPGQGLDLSQVRSVYLTQFRFDGDAADVHYPLALLQDHPERQTLTDSHYGDLGNLHLAAEVVRVMQDRHDPAHLSAHVASRAALAQPAEITGDLGLQCTPQRSETRLRLPPPDRRLIASNGLAAGNNGIIYLLENKVPPGTGTLLIFGDSFFRCLLDELIPFWDAIVFVRSTHFHYELVQAVRPAAILTGMAERYIAAQVPDEGRPHLLALPLIAGRAQSPDPGFAPMWTRLIDQTALAQVPGAALPATAPVTVLVTAGGTGAGMTATQILEQTAFALWRMREGDSCGLEGAARSALWARARPGYLEEARVLLDIMGARGLQISGLPRG